MTNQRTEISHRLKILISLLSSSVKAFSVEIDVANSYLSEILHNKRDASGDVLRKIAHHPKRPNLNWLITGEGEMLREPPPLVAGVAESRAVYAGKEGVLESILRRLQILENEVAALRSLPGIAKIDT